MSTRRGPAFLLLLAGTASGAPDVEALGSRLAALDRALYSCTRSGAHTLCRPAGNSPDHLGLPVLEVTLEYRGELLQRKTVFFDESHFADIDSRLTARFGSPEHHDERLRAGMAGTIINRIRVWRSGGDIAMLEQYAEKITTSALRYLAADEYRELMRSRDSMRVRGTRDL